MYFIDRTRMIASIVRAILAFILPVANVVTLQRVGFCHCCGSENLRDEHSEEMPFVSFRREGEDMPLVDDSINFGPSRY